MDSILIWHVKPGLKHIRRWVSPALGGKWCSLTLKIMSPPGCCESRATGSSNSGHRRGCSTSYLGDMEGEPYLIMALSLPSECPSDSCPAFHFLSSPVPNFPNQRPTNKQVSFVRNNGCEESSPIETSRRRLSNPAWIEAIVRIRLVLGSWYDGCGLPPSIFIRGLRL